MEHINDYLMKNLDKSIKDKPLNEVDFSLLSQLSYVNFEDIVSSGSAKISFHDAYLKYKELGRTGPHDELFTKVANSERYKNLKLSHFVVKENPETLEQFGAYAVDTGLNHKAVFFRPTNGSLFAWKENFTVAFKESSITQQDASEYFNKLALQHPFQRFSLIGHSKGGNNAMYAGANANLFNQAKIKQIINFDGPGFNSRLNPGVTNPLLLDKITTYIPEGSVVGRLLDHKEKMVIVKGNDPHGVGQHDMNEWLVGEDGFERAKETNYKSDIIDKKFKEVMAKHDEAFLQDLINGLFDILYNTGYTNLDDIIKNPKTLFNGYFRTDKKLRGVVRKVALSVLRDKKFMKAMFGKKRKDVEKTIATIATKDKPKDKKNNLEAVQSDDDCMQMSMN